MSPFADIAISSPFAGKDQRGQVLIYNGNKDGLNTKPSQILQGVWASQTIPSGFGFTLRGDSDIDKNDYPGKGFFPLPPESPFPRKKPIPRMNASRVSFSLLKAKAQLNHGWPRAFVPDS